MFPVSGTFKILGRITCFWIAVSIAASGALAATDYALASFLQLLLKSLELTPANTRVSGLLANWEPSVRNLLLMLALIAVLRGLAQFWVFQSTDLIKECVNTRLRLFSLYQILRIPAQKFVSAAETNSRIGEIFPQTAQFFWYSSVTLSFAIQCIVLLAGMIYTAWKEASLGILGLGFIGLLILKINKRVRAVGAKVPEEQKSLVTGIERVSRNWLLVKVLRTNDREYQLLSQKSLNYYNHFIRAKFLGNIGAVTSIVLGIALLMLIIFVNLSVWKTPGFKLLACIYLFSRFLSSFVRLARGFGLINSTLPHFKAAAFYVSNFNPTEFKDAVFPMGNVTPMGKISKVNTNLPNHVENNKPLEISQLDRSPPTPPRIELENLSFAYTANSPRVLDNISLKIDPGEQVGFIGKSGSGKSTLLGLILGVLHPQEGTITIDGINPTDFFSQPSNRIGYVGAEPFLIEGSIKDNLDYGSRKTYSPEEYRNALTAASLLDVVENLPNQLDYWISENSEGLSAGQKQRLSLARALLSQPHILVLDEASANLDDQTEAEIASSIENLKGSCTVIIVSHRPGILKYADKILKLSGSKISV